jgi:hypothetical protein
MFDARGRSLASLVQFTITPEINALSVMPRREGTKVSQWRFRERARFACDTRSTFQTTGTLGPKRRGLEIARKLLRNWLRHGPYISALELTRSINVDGRARRNEE